MPCSQLRQGEAEAIVLAAPSQGVLLAALFVQIHLDVSPNPGLVLHVLRRQNLRASLATLGWNRPSHRLFRRPVASTMGVLVSARVRGQTAAKYVGTAGTASSQVQTDHSRENEQHGGQIEE